MKYLSLLITAFVLLSCQSKNFFIEFSLNPAKDRYVNEVVELELPPELTGDFPLRLSRTDSHEQIPVQRSGQSKAVFLLDSVIQAGKKINYRLEKGEVEINPKVSPFILMDEPDKVRIFVKGKPVLTYHTATVFPPDGFPQYYQRSGFIHPLYSPSRKVITDGFPKDHMHQHGIFFAWVNTTFRGKFTDFWNQAEQNAMVRHMYVEKMLTGPVFAEFTCWIEHLAIQEGDTIPALREQWKLRVYAVDDPFLIDFTSQHQMVGEDTLFINKYRYGGFGIRGSAEWDDHDFKQPEDSAVNYIGNSGKGGFLTSEGKTRIAGNHTRPYWVDFHGTVDGEKLGVLAMGHPDNFRYPQAIRIHPTMPYFCFAPMVTDSFEIRPADTYVSAYRLVVHDEFLPADRLNQWWEGYKNQLNISLVKD